MEPTWAVAVCAPAWRRFRRCTRTRYWPACRSPETWPRCSPAAGQIDDQLRRVREEIVGGGHGGSRRQRRLREIADGRGQRGLQIWPQCRPAVVPMVNWFAPGGEVVVACSVMVWLDPSGSVRLNAIELPGFGFDAARSTEIDGGEPRRTGDGRAGQARVHAGQLEAERRASALTERYGGNPLRPTAGRSSGRARWRPDRPAGGRP